MNHISRILLLAMLLLGGGVLYSITLQHAFAASEERSSHSTIQQDPNNYIEGFQDGVKAGYSDGLTSCTIRQIQLGESQTFDPSAPPPTPYENGYSQGYASGNQKGTDACQTQSSGINSTNSGFPFNNNPAPSNNNSIPFSVS